MSDLEITQEAQGRVGHYPQATVAAYLKACWQIGADHSRQLFTDFLATLQEKFQERGDRAESDKDARHLHEVVTFLSRQGPAMQEQFLAVLGEGFIRFGADQPTGGTGEASDRGNSLALVDNEDLEERIALSSIAHRADERFGESLWFLTQRLAVLNGGRKVRENDNPLGPSQFCSALRKSLGTLPASTREKILAYKYFENVLSAKLGEILADSNRYLANKGILPNLNYLSSVKSRSAPAAAPQAESDSTVPAQAPAAQSDAGSPDPSASVLIQAIRTLQQYLGSASLTFEPAAAAPLSLPVSKSPETQAAAKVHHYSNQQLVTALHKLQGQALALSSSAVNGPGAPPLQEIASVSRRAVEELKQNGDRVDAMDMQTIDLVGMLFEYMLSDGQLPDSIKTILSYLHTPFLKVAFIDCTFFEKSEHPARLLLNSLAEAGTRWVGNDGTSQYEVYNKIRETVFRVLEEFEHDVRLFAELLLDFSSYVRKIVRRQDLIERRAMEQVQGEEKLREVKLRINREIRARIDGQELPSAVLLLLLQPWSDYLSFLLLRYGENSASWKRAVSAVDQIVASIKTAAPGEDRTRKLQQLDDLMETVEEGFNTIGYDQGKAAKLLSALASLQRMAMDSKQPSPAPAPVRSKWETDAAQKAGAEQAGEAMTDQERSMVENLKMIEFGTWFEFESGRRLKVAWYNSKTLQYMLVDQMGKKVAMKSGLELARGMLSGKARVIAGSTKPFFDRALENILENLNVKAGAIQAESSDA